MPHTADELDTLATLYRHMTAHAHGGPQTLFLAPADHGRLIDGVLEAEGFRAEMRTAWLDQGRIEVRITGRRDQASGIGDQGPTEAPG